MTAPAGAIVGIYVDLVARVEVGHVIQTQTGRRYGVVSVRVQQRGKHRGRQHLRCVVLAPDDIAPCVGTVQLAPSNATCRACGVAGQRCEQRVHEIRWYRR